MKSKRVNNQKLMDCINKYYINGNATQQEIADDMGISLGAVKNFMYRHNINKKLSYKIRNNNIKYLYKNGITVKSICNTYNTTSQNVYTILNN